MNRLTKRGSAALRTPLTVQDGDDEVTLENYDDLKYGYLRIVANATQLRIGYHPAIDGDAQKTPNDSVTVDLATRNLGIYQAVPGEGACRPSTAGTMSALAAGDVVRD